jgi:hypothetical protein
MAKSGLSYALEPVRLNPADRKKDHKSSVLTAKKGNPLSIVISGTNTHVIKCLVATLNGIVIERPVLIENQEQNLCMDVGFVWKHPNCHSRLNRIRKI